MVKEERQILEEKYGGLPDSRFEADCARLAGGEPLAYVIGWQPFLGLKIYLDSKPLIPRPETEWWTEQLLQAATARRLKDVSDGDGRRDSKFLAKNYACPEGGAPLCFLDLCAGSGAIGCAALKCLPDAHVYFGELDPAHEATIRKNIRENNLDDARASIGIGDLFAPLGDMRFDIIAANPPYVPADRVLTQSVADYEPARALFAGADGLAIIRRIAATVRCHLTEGGQAWIECDRGHAESTRALFAEQDLNAEIRTDQHGKPRIVLVSFP